jgi:hypothetical protein
MKTIGLLGRSLGVVLCVAPVFLLVASAIHVPLHPLHVPRALDGVLTALGALAMLAALAVCVLNRRLSSLDRPAKHVSPVPMVGTFLVVIGGLLGYGSLLLALLGLTALALDTGGSLRVLVALFRGDGTSARQ